MLVGVYPDPSEVGRHLASSLRRFANATVMLARPLRHELEFGLLKVSFRLARRGNLDINVEPDVARGYAMQLERAGSDFILATDPIPAAFIDARTPYAVFSDAPVSGLKRLGYYLDGWSQRSLSNWEALDRAALTGARAIFFTSVWAARAAVEDYGLNPAFVHVVSMGAGVDDPACDTDFAEGSSERCELLFCGRDWRRKGGEQAYAITKLLNERGFRARLTVVGPDRLPTRYAMDPDVEFVGRIVKSADGARANLASFYRRAHFLLLPTRADCTPVAIAEAAAYGVPSVASDVGGIASMIDDGVTGSVLSASASARDYADRIVAAYDGGDGSYTDMRRAARNAYLERLNWDRSTAEMLSILRAEGHC